ncbi:hypothetical protein PUF88_01425 [Lactobacillaceae bacterium L1_55_11]|nr:hypothetical protein [Lactobacillaceae bacterium L1_55_11]
MPEKNSFFKRHQIEADKRQRMKARQKVEREYARQHPKTIEVVEPENRSEMRLTHHGRFEMGSDGQLTTKGKTDRLSYRYNWAMIILGVMIVILYLYFFFVN